MKLEDIMYCAVIELKDNVLVLMPGEVIDSNMLEIVLHFKYDDSVHKFNLEFKWDEDGTCGEYWFNEELGTLVTINC